MQVIPIFALFTVLCNYAKCKEPENLGTSTGGIRIHNLDDDEVPSGASELIPPKDKSYWIPYTERITAAMNFPVVPEQLFHKPVQEPEPENPWNKWTYGPIKQKFEVKAKPKSDLGVIVSRSYILKENFRDYENLCTFPKDQQPPNELILDMSKQLIDTKYHVASENVVTVAVESRLRTPVIPDVFKSQDTLGLSRVLHNGTVTIRPTNNNRQMLSIPFILSSLVNLNPMSRKLEKIESHLSSRDQKESLSFVKFVLSTHSKSFDEGMNALERIQERGKNLKRPYFFVSLENATRLSANDKQRLDEEEMERRAKEVASFGQAWLHTTTVAMRVISPATYYLKEIPLVYVPVIHPQVIVKGLWYN